MNSDELCFLSAGQLSRLIQNKEISPVEIVKAHLSRIERLEPTLNSFITLLSNEALAEARKAEKEIRRGRCRGPLHGIPMAVKDLFSVKGVRNTLGSKIFDRSVADVDSTLIARLKKSGAILLGKLNMNPLAYGPIAKERDYDYGHMHNPWNPEYISGGSSGGSGSATASGQVTVALGSDTGGSVRIPCALCGLVGLKPTYGRLSRYGLATLSWSLDHAGPMTRTVEDCALAMNAMAGYDPKDPSSARVPVPDYTKALIENIKGLRVGIPKEYFMVPLDPQIKHSVLKALDRLRELGATVTEVSWPLYPYYESISTKLLMAEGTASHRKLVTEGGSGLYDPLRLRLEAGFFISAPDYIQAQQARVLFNRESLDLFEKVDVLAGPTTPIIATKIGVTDVTVDNTNMGVIAAHTQYTSSFNLNGFPAITLPCGFSEGFPVGLQLVGRPFDEETVLRTAHAYEQATEWHKRRPSL
jgi:aspartyl-tRNA(Asn)/glutamyl-tRNA(Gln) amidotransferase subunit A